MNFGGRTLQRICVLPVEGGKFTEGARSPVIMRRAFWIVDGRICRLQFSKSRNGNRTTGNSCRFRGDRWWSVSLRSTYDAMTGNRQQAVILCKTDADKLMLRGFVNASQPADCPLTSLFPRQVRAIQH